MKPLMTKTILSLAIAALVPALANAENDAIAFYGKANVAFQSTDEGDGSVTDVKNNASYLGVKGWLPLDHGLRGVFKMEYQVDIDGEAEDTFQQRNIYAGLEGTFGQLIAGKFDTPLKVAQNKVDLFNELEGDIKSVITRSDNRESNNLQYTTPSFMGFKVAAAYISNRNKVIGVDESGRELTRDNATSVSLAYDRGGVYLAYAYDRDVEANDWEAQRFVARYKIARIQAGALFETQEKPDGSTQDGWLVSAAYNFSHWTIKAQYGLSDIVLSDAETYSLGLDYKLSNAVKLFGFYTDETAAGGYERSYFGVGTELKF